jgi:hypothetical protein
MPDLLDSIVKELRERLQELRPLVAEYERLQAAERALGDGAPPAAARRSGGARRRGATATARAATRESILALIGERPGISKAELRHATGLSGAGIAQNLRRMIGRGEVVEESLPGGETGYRLGTGERPQATTAPES